MKSIIIPVYNGHDYTDECIQAVLENTTDCEIIVVDNGSDPPYKPPFSGFINTHILRNETNLGFPAAVNRGINFSGCKLISKKDDVIILLNSDVIVTPGWAERLTGYLDEFSIVGPVTNFAAGLQRVAIETYQSKPGLYDAAAAWAQDWDGEVEEVNFVIGFCMAFRQSLFDEIGPFDESLWPCSGEEIDFCFRAREAGHRILIARDCYVHHEGSQTLSAMERDGQIDYAEICKRNDEHLAKKWGADFWMRQACTSVMEMPQNAPGEAIRLNLGCGYAKIPGFTNIDNRAEVNPDLVCDVIQGLPYSDNSVDEIRAYDFLEHIPIGQTIQVIAEIWRVLKPDGKFESLTPSTDGRGAFQDPTHVSFWNQNSWFYYSHDAYRNLYGIEANFKIDLIEDIEINPGMKVIHTHVIGSAIK